MKAMILIAMAAVALLQCVSSAPANAHEMLKTMYGFAKDANATLPGHLLNTTVPMVEGFENNTFCRVQQALMEHATKDKQIKLLCRSLTAYNHHTGKNCTNERLPNTYMDETFTLQELLVHLMICINKESMKS
ncbi:hypothetical protein NHX12_010180 [Muraenolepis orangiensis]|uniref:Uncharacterized protein n=1 Tax=Muraenolepis orangiensis TaxID=630683 RepID=A0A9Q0DIL6_9TELE|nr:hypothetical protein NHX12_010180 [Muraenolepis orangiensis]